MTSDEAKKKFCPFNPLALGPSNQPVYVNVSYGGTGAAGGVGYAMPVRGISCQGDACMLWVGDGCGLVSRHKNES